jgi:hypothetical protein
MASIDFHQLIDRLEGGEVGTDEPPTILGGRIQADALPGFLTAWNLDGRNMPWRIWEWVSDLLWEYGASSLPFDSTAARRRDWLERARFFGPGGDLSLRRDSDEFLWHFVGPHDADLPSKFINEIDCPQGAKFDNLVAFRSAMALWGNKRPLPGGGVFWQEDRVAGGKRPLHYPGAGEPDRVQLAYCEYLQGADVVAVWWLGLEGLQQPSEEASDE